MLIYCITLFLVTLFSVSALGVQNYINTNSYVSSWRTKNFFVYLVALVFIFFAGFRYQVGSDWAAYYFVNHNTFETILSKSYAEPGWYLLGYLSTSVFDHYGVAMFIASFVTISLYIRTISKYSYCFVLSVLLFFFIEWAGTFNGVRQYLAAAILFSGHRFLLDRNLYKWLFVVLFATLFHTTAILMFPIFFVVDKKFNLKYFIVIVVVGLILFFSYDRIYDFISFYKEKEIDASTAAYMSNSVNVLRILLTWLPILFYTSFVSKKQSLYYSRELNFYANLTFINAVLMTAAMNSTYLARVGIYTGCFNLIAWPIFITHLSDRSKRVAYIALVLLYFCYWFYDTSVHKDINNFRLIFNYI